MMQTIIIIVTHLVRMTSMHVHDMHIHVQCTPTRNPTTSLCMQGRVTKVFKYELQVHVHAHVHVHDSIVSSALHNNYM